MFRPFRLITFGVLALLVYMGFYAAPVGGPDSDDFNPEAVAGHEVALWQAARVGEEMSAFTSAVLLQRELHRYSWFRSVESGLALSRASVQFARMTGRYERVLPYLTEIASIEKQWREADFDADRVARSRLSWWTATHRPSQDGGIDQAASEMADEYGAWYALRADEMYPATGDRAVAYQMIHAPGVDPDWPEIDRLLEASYRTLQATLVAAHSARTAL